MDNIILKGIKFYGYHGVYDFEKTNGQYFLIDIKIYLKIKSENDSLESVINYGEIYYKIEKEFYRYKRNLLETLAEEINNEILCFNKEIKKVKTKIVKITPPINANIKEIGIKLCTKRK